MLYELKRLHMVPQVLVYDNVLTRARYFLYILFYISSGFFHNFKNTLQNIFKIIISRYYKCIYG